ncbi:actin-like protein Arp8p [Diutina catenulata]
MESTPDLESSPGIVPSPMEPVVEPSPGIDVAEPSVEPSVEPSAEPSLEPDAKRQRKPTPKKSVEMEQKRKEGRARAAATLAHRTGIYRQDDDNAFPLTVIKQAALINQKNYFTDYLKKDEQVGFIRQWRKERDFIQKVKKGQVDEDTLKEAMEGRGEIPKFEYFDLVQTVNEKKAGTAVADDEEDDDDADVDVSDDKMKNGYDVIIIHPGSAVTRIGRATDIFPQSVPSVVAVRTPTPVHHDGEPAPPRESSPEFDAVRSEVRANFKERMKYYKRRILPNSHETVSNFNRKQVPEEVPEHSDPSPKEWLSANPPDSVLVGEDALRLPMDSANAEGEYPQWKLRYPIVNGTFNQNSPDYASPQDLMGDATNLVLHALSKLDIRHPGKLKCVLVIADLYDKAYVETWMRVLLRLVGFSRVGMIQESVAATFGAGATSACVIDVGAHTTSVSCVEEGMVINDSRIKLGYGGDLITEAFVKMLLENNFPYADINLLRRNDDWELADELKSSFGTFSDADVAVQLYNFYQRKPYQPTLKYEFKVFDAVMLAPLGVYYPKLFDGSSVPSLASTPDPHPKSERFFKASADEYTEKNDNPTSKVQQELATSVPYAELTDDAILRRLCDFKKVVPTPEASEEPLEVSLEKAIIDSITAAGLASDMGKLAKMYDNLLVVGGGLGKFPGFDSVLADRINIFRPKFLSTTATDKIIDYAQKELKKGAEQRQKLTTALKLERRTSKEQTLDDIELTEEEKDRIASESEVVLDLDHVDSLCDAAEVLPVSVLPPPREFDPEMLVWKGGSVFGRLKVSQELWITSNDWDVMDSRCLYYKSLFHY